jgi:hypothetical protein
MVVGVGLVARLAMKTSAGLVVTDAAWLCASDRPPVGRWATGGARGKMRRRVLAQGMPARLGAWQADAMVHHEACIIPTPQYPHHQPASQRTSSPPSGLALCPARRPARRLVPRPPGRLLAGGRAVAHGPAAAAHLERAPGGRQRTAGSALGRHRPFPHQWLIIVPPPLATRRVRVHCCATACESLQLLWLLHVQQAYSFGEHDARSPAGVVSNADRLQCRPAQTSIGLKSDRRNQMLAIEITLCWCANSIPASWPSAVLPRQRHCLHVRTSGRPAGRT